jgi:pimeloyl-ACP methyl ester carboxylesterase
LEKAVTGGIASGSDSPEPYPSGWLPEGVQSRFVQEVNGLSMHVLEAGMENAGGGCVLLLHGFPELAYSWRKLLLPLARAGYHVLAPDQRGYGRTTGWDPDYDGEVASYRPLNLVRDALDLVSACGYRSIAAVIGHDFGSPVAGWCALARPDVFRSVVLMSAPFGGAPSLPRGGADTAEESRSSTGELGASLAALSRPRKHYQHYYGRREANDDMWHAEKGVHAFLRAYYHHKSADWPSGWTAEQLALMPTYYVMDLDEGMGETVAVEMPSAARIAANNWLPEHELRVYSEEFARTGFQGGLQWYRARGIGAAETELFAGRTIDQPSMFVAGASDWGVHQAPGVLEAMQTQACTDMQGVHLVEGAGHWVQQEQPEETTRLVLEFLRQNPPI